MKKDKSYSEWLRNYWRPMMAFVYMAIVLFDFIIAPSAWSILQLFGGSLSTQWSPLTLVAGGVFHAAMGAVLGITAFTRGQEKIEGMRTQLHGNDNNTQDAGTHNGIDDTL